MNCKDSLRESEMSVRILMRKKHQPSKTATRATTRRVLQPVSRFPPEVEQNLIDGSNGFQNAAGEIAPEGLSTRVRCLGPDGMQRPRSNRKHLEYFSFRRNACQPRPGPTVNALLDEFDKKAKRVSRSRVQYGPDCKRRNRRQNGSQTLNEVVSLVISHEIADDQTQEPCVSISQHFID